MLRITVSHPVISKEVSHLLAHVWTYAPSSPANTTEDGAEVAVAEVTKFTLLQNYGMRDEDILDIIDPGQ
jgi:hypothetical protein